MMCRTGLRSDETDKEEDMAFTEAGCSGRA